MSLTNPHSSSTIRRTPRADGHALKVGPAGVNRCSARHAQPMLLDGVLNARQGRAGGVFVTQALSESELVARAKDGAETADAGIL